MTPNNVRTMLASLMLVLSVVAVGATPAAAQADSEVNIVLKPANGEVQPNGEVTYDVVVKGAVADVESYDVTIELSDDDVAEITELEDAYAGGTGSVNVADDNSSVSFDRALFNSRISQTDFTLATLTLSAIAAEGTTTVSVANAQINDVDGEPYTNNELGSADLTVSANDNGGGGVGDVDVVFEPSDQEVQPNGQVTYDIVVQGNEESLSAYEGTVEIANPNVAEITELEDAYAGGTGSVNVADDGSSVTFDRALFGTTISKTEFTIAKVTVSAGDTEGDTTLSVADAKIGESTTNELGTASVTVDRPKFPDVTGNGKPAQDLNGDGFPEDINGDGDFDIFDVQSLYQDVL